MLGEEDVEGVSKAWESDITATTPPPVTKTSPLPESYTALFDQPPKAIVLITVWLLSDMIETVPD